jgi:phage shock protein C
MTDPTGSCRFSPNHLYRDPDNGPVLGVWAGVAEYIGVTPMAVRVVAVFGLVFFHPAHGYRLWCPWHVPRHETDGLFADDEEEYFWRAVCIDTSQTAADLGHRFRDMECRLRAAEVHVTSSEFKLNRDYRNLRALPGATKDGPCYHERLLSAVRGS